MLRLPNLDAQGRLLAQSASANDLSNTKFIIRKRG